MKNTFLSLPLLYGALFLPFLVKSQCNLSNYTTAIIIPATSYPYTSGGLTISATTANVTTLTNTSYDCSGNTFTTASPAWWLSSNTSLITLTFSTAVSNFTVVVNGTNNTEIFTFNASTGSISLSDYCTAGFSVVGAGNQLLCSASGTTGTIININNPTGATQYTLTHNGLGAGSRIALLDCNITPLPTQLTSFSGQIIAERESIQLMWETFSENNNDYFQIERGANSINFAPIGTEKSGANPQSIQSYQFVDDNPMFGKNYYRLKMVDIDGKYQYSDIIEFEFKGDEIRVFPNPTTGVFRVEGKAITEGTIAVFDPVGRLIQSQNISDSQEIDLSNQPNGTYFLKIASNGGTQVKRIIKR